MNDLTMTVERTINAPQEAVFNAWLDADKLRQFMTPAPGVTVPKASTDAKQGGRFDIIMKDGEQEIPHAGTYKEISPHDRIVFTWESPYSADDSTVTLTFAPVDGGTHVTLTHVRFADQQSRGNHQRGWTSILGTLEGLLNGKA